MMPCEITTYITSRICLILLDSSHFRTSVVESLTAQYTTNNFRYIFTPTDSVETRFFVLWNKVGSEYDRYDYAHVKSDTRFDANPLFLNRWTNS
eukprot:945033-Amphidinium_carterae.1